MLGLGKLPEGTVEGINSIAVSDLEAFKKSFFAGKNIAVVGAGSLDHNPLLDTTTKLLGGISASPSASPSPNVFVGSDIEYRFDSMRVIFGITIRHKASLGGTCCSCFRIRSR